MAQLRPPEKLVILADLHLGMSDARDELVRIAPDQHMGKLYPFTLNQKLDRITVNSTWYSDAASSPWGRAIIPLEMMSVLAGYTTPQAQFPVRQPVVGLFADQELRMVDGPLFVRKNCLIRREVVALSESRRTESYWVRTRIFDEAGQQLKAEMLLNHATLKQSFLDCEKLRNAD